jgi:hypothetical protein
VPTPQQVQGNFGTVPIYNLFALTGSVRQQFAGNMIPARLLDPVGAKLAGLYPAPNQPGLVNNYAYNQAQTNDGDEIDSRFDGHLSDRDSMFVSFSHNNTENTTGPWFAPPGNGGTSLRTEPFDVPIHAYLVTAGEAHIFRQRLSTVSIFPIRTRTPIS